MSMTDEQELNALLAELEDEDFGEAEATPAAEPEQAARGGKVEPEPEPEEESLPETEPEPEAQPEEKAKPEPKAKVKPAEQPAQAATQKTLAEEMREANRPKFFINMDKFADDVKFHPQDLQTAYSEQASLYIHYATAKAKAHLQAKRYKQRLELLQAQLDNKVRKKAAETNEKVTEKVVEARVMQTVAFQEAKDAQLEAEHIYDTLAEVVESFKHRRDMLIQAGADIRVEKQGALRLNEASANTKQDLLEARRKVS